MKRIICLILALMCVFCFFGCTEDKDAKNDNSQNKKVEIDLKALGDKIITDLKIEDTFELNGDQIISKYGIEEADYKEAVCLMKMEGVFPDEILMFRATDGDALERIEEKLSGRLEAVLKQSKDYSPEDYKIAQKCSVVTEGDYVVLFVSSQHESMQELFLDSFK